MQSDDYYFLDKGFSYKATIGMYFSWSGRIIADFLASLILSTQNRVFISGFNASMLMLLIYLLVKIPRRSEPQQNSGNLVIFLLLFCLYWIANPALGQTTLWVVGAANYVWTNVIQLAFLTLFVAEMKRRTAVPARRVLLIFLAVAAGITNENTAVTTSLLVGFFTLREFYNDRRNWLLVACLGAVLAGTLVLLLAPGNFARLTFAPPEWGNSPLVTKLSVHFGERMPWMLLQYWQAIAAFFTLLVFLPSKSEARFYALSFAGASVVAGCALVALPSISHRTINGSLVYLLIAISFAAHELLKQSTWRRHTVSLLTAIAVVYFSVSYVFVFNAYRDFNEQALYRDGVVAAAVRNGEQTIEIPEFYRGQLLKPHDGPDWYFAGNAMARYFGTQAEITQYGVTNTYGGNFPPIRRP